MFKRIDEAEAVYISVDDVLVKHQKDVRNNPGYAKAGKNVANTVIHVQARGRVYVISAIGMANAFIMLVAFLLENRLMENWRLVFLPDGATDIKDNIKRFFSWRPWKLILDWYHLAKGIKEFSSMCMKGKKEGKQETVKRILHHKWVGDVDGAIAYVNSIGDKLIKNAGEMASYLSRKKENVCCHALRRAFNFEDVFQYKRKAQSHRGCRQPKHNGMSWSNMGSGSFATLKTIIKNSNGDKWIRERAISFNLKEAGWKGKSKRAA